MGDITNVNELSVAAQAFYDTATGNTGFGTSTPASKVAINGGLHVGGDSDAGDNNIIVDGTATISSLTTGIVKNTDGLLGVASGSDLPTHTHTKLVASDGSPDPSLSIDSNGNMIAVESLYQENGKGLNIKNNGGTYRSVLVLDSSNNLVLGGVVDGSLKFNTGAGAERMMIDSSGKIGVGVTPEAWYIYEALQIGNFAIADAPLTADARLVSNLYYDSSNFWKYITSALSATMVQIGNGDFSIYNAPSGTADDTASLTIRLIIDTSGNVGIGTASPETLLHLKSTTTPVLKIEDSDGAVGGKVLLKNGATNVLAANNLGIIDFSAMVGGVESRMARISAGAGASNTQEGKIQFWTADGADVAERVTIAKNGDVGIGTATPSATIDVRGTAHFGGNDGDIYFDTETLNQGYSSNSEDSLLINYKGYQGGLTQFRNTHILDGKSNYIAQFNGSTKQSTFYGKINNTTLSNYASNCLAVAGGLSVGDFYRQGDFVCVVHE